ncbi:MAG: hypothetical protein G01um101470_307 [Parcubacteria group bacterium Gr01-1014_70]|nr:MAG: hypothetical protein G01um101470_307 [Parcubacteria group bacterium Gr01-1014_70]
MQNSKIVFVTLAFVVFAVGAFYITTRIQPLPKNQPQGDAEQPSPQTAPANKNQPSTSPGSAKTPGTAPKSTTQIEGARLVVAIKDDTVPLKDVSSILLSVTGISIHEPKKGWVVVSNELRTYDLLRLKQESRLELMFDINTQEGAYNQLRLTVGSVIVMKGGVAYTAKLPSGIIHIPFSLPVKNKQTSAITLDFIADKSLHTTGANEFIFAPVLTVNTFSEIDTVQQMGTKIEIFGGYPRFAGSFGMDENGDIKSNSNGIDSLSRIEIARNVFVLIPRSMERSRLQITPESAIDTAIAKAYITQARSVHAVMLGDNPAWEVLGVTTGRTVHVYIDGVSGGLVKVE